MFPFRGADWGLEAKGKRLDVASQLKLGFLGFKFLHKKPDHLEFLLFCPKNKKKIEIMKSFHACSENMF